MKYKVGDKVKIRKGSLAGNIYTISHIASCGHIKLSDLPYVFFDYELEPADADGGKIAYAPNGAALFWMPEPEKPVSIEEQLGLPKGVSIHDLPISEWYNPMRLTFKNGSFIEALPQSENTVRGENHFCNGFRGGKIPEYVLNEKQAKEYADNMMATAESISNITGISYEDSINKLKTWLSTFSNDGISAKNGGKNSMKFTFYTVEGYRIDKSNNTKIPTVTTEVVYKDKDGCATGGLATCDKADYNSRQGVLEALANMCCGGNFDREYNKAVKDNARADKTSRTCTYCGQLFDTIAEKEAHEAWHVECRKARHERYLLRKRAKEIAFEEAAQKLAKEIIAEDNKK